jgi:hypothetical protein
MNGLKMPAMTPEEKAALLRAGIEDTRPRPEDTIQALCLAVAYLTSPEKSKRETAKRRIREYVEIGKTRTGL